MGLSLLDSTPNTQAKAKQTWEKKEIFSHTRVYANLNKSLFLVELALTRKERRLWKNSHIEWLCVQYRMVLKGPIFRTSIDINKPHTNIDTDPLSRHTLFDEVRLNRVFTKVHDCKFNKPVSNVFIYNFLCTNISPE